MIIDNLTIAGALIFVGLSAFLILMSRSAVKNGEFRSHFGGPRCNRFYD